MMRERMAFGSVLAYVWAQMILFGANLFETLIVYPNIFHDVPRSLETTMAFMVVAGPGDFFRTFGMLGMLIGIAAVVLVWETASARYWVLASVVVVLIGQFLLSAAFFWPRNAIMFAEGAAIHSVAQLQQTAWEFQTAHWLRLAMTAAGPALCFMGLGRLYRHRIEFRASWQGTDSVAAEQSRNYRRA